MYETIYIEREVRDHPIAVRIVERLEKVDVIECNRYTEIFNRRGQDFRLQKQAPSLVLACKHDGFVIAAPDGYGVGGDKNYYFSIMLNCLYDCRYCFLQGMYRSAHHVVFVNYEDFLAGIHEKLARHSQSEKIWFFSGYDCDSLAMEPMFGYAEYFMQAAQAQPNLWLELRTKSTQIRSLLERSPIRNVVVAFSFTPQCISAQLEHRVPSVRKRIKAISKLQEHGWTVGLRFDPLIYVSDYRRQYQNLFHSLFSNLDAEKLHSVSFGAFRLPKIFFRNLERLYPDDAFIAQPFESRNRQVSYPASIEAEMKNWCHARLCELTDHSKVYFAEPIS